MRFATSFVAMRTGYVIAALLLGPLASYAAGAPAARQSEFAVCAPCNSISPPAKKTGPSPTRIVRRRNGVGAGYRYSASSTNTIGTRDDVALNRFLMGPVGLAAGAKTFRSVQSSPDRQDLIADVNTSKWTAQQDVDLPPQNSYRSRDLHRLSRACAFHYDDMRRGLRC